MSHTSLIFFSITLEVTQTLSLIQFCHSSSSFKLHLSSCCGLAISLYELYSLASLNLLMLVCNSPHYADSLIDKLTCVRLPDTGTNEIFLHLLDGFCQQ